MAHGMAPKNGPKKGIMFVTPIITLTKAAYGVPKMLVPTKQIIPIIKESITLKFHLTVPENTNNSVPINANPFLSLVIINNNS